MPEGLETPRLVAGDGWLIARYPRVHCTYFGPRVSPRAFDAHIEQLARDVDERPSRERIGVLYYVPESATVDSPRRRRIAKFLDERKDKLERTTAAYAMATSSPFVRGVLTTLFWMAPPRYPHKMVATTKQGLDFIGEHIRGVDMNRLHEAFTATLHEHLREAC